MPHRKSPSKVAENFIKHTAKFDRLKKEASNTVSEEEVLAELCRVFPVKPNSPESPGVECFPVGWIGQDGLILFDSRGEGVLD